MEGTDRPLVGRRILVTRPAGRGLSLESRLERLGARVECRPTIALEPPGDPAPARRAVAELDRYDWLLFTSPSGVRFFLSTLGEEGGSAGAIAARIGAVGPSTALALGEAGLAPDVVARDSRAEGLAKDLRGRIESGGRVLVVRPEVTRPVLVEALKEMGASPVPVVFYRTVADPGAAEVARSICAGRYDTVVFTSSSTFERLLDRGEPGRKTVVDALRGLRLVAIGPVTAATIRRAGLETAGVAAKPSDDGIVSSILAAEGQGD